MAFIYDLDTEGQGKIISDAGSDASALKILSGVATQPALEIGRTVNGNVTIAPLSFLGTSLASGALMHFAGGFISLTSVVLTSVANFDYALPVVVGGQQRYIPLVKAAGLVGGAAF